MKKLFKKIDESLYDAMGKVSHTKISSYIILLGIYISSMVFLTIDIVNAMMTWIGDGEVYTIPGAHIGLFTLLLGHHLALLGIKKNSENKAIESPNTDTNINREQFAETLPESSPDSNSKGDDIDDDYDYEEGEIN